MGVNLVQLRLQTVCAACTNEHILSAQQCHLIEAVDLTQPVGT